MKDTLVRLPFMKMKNRPQIALPKDKTRGSGSNRGR
jgi:hypothetical protein